MHHFPPFQPNPKGMSTTGITVRAPDTPPPSPPSSASSSSSSPLGVRAAAAAAAPSPRPRRAAAEEAPCFAHPVLRAPLRRRHALLGNGAAPTLAEIEEELRGEAVPRPRPAKRTRYQAGPPIDPVSRLPSPPPSPPSSCDEREEDVPTAAQPRATRREPAPLRSALRTSSSSSSSSSTTFPSLSSSRPPSKPRKTVRFAAAAPETQFFASWDAPSSLKLLRRTPERAVPDLAAGARPPPPHSGPRSGPLPPSPPPAWHWTLRTPDLQAAAQQSPQHEADAAAAAPVRLRDLYLGSRRPSVLGLVSVARSSSSSSTAASATAAAWRAPPGVVVCECSLDGGRTWTARVGAGWFCAAPRCDWFQFALDGASLGLGGGGGEDDNVASWDEGEGPASSNNNNTMALRVRYQDKHGREWVDDNHGAGFEVRFELCWAGEVDDDWGTPEELGWDE